jgi:hypothetical protein
MTSIARVDLRMNNLTAWSSLCEEYGASLLHAKQADMIKNKILITSIGS